MANSRWSLFVLLSLWCCTLTFADQVFFASEVSYCSEARAIEIKEFLLEYNNEDKTISFDINANSVEADLGAILELSLDAYGIDALNTSINLCTELSGLLCPLPQYNFVASATLPLPPSIADDIDIPGIGYKIPDLEAVATVRLIRVSNGTEAACLRVRLSNGESVRLAGVSWALGGIVLGAIALGLLRMLVNLWRRDDVAVARGRSKERLLEIFGWYQFVAVTGLLSLNYPLIYTSYTANFAWALGIIYIQPFQVSIDNLRASTGGNLTRLAGSLNLVGGTEKTRQTVLVSNARAAMNLASSSSLTSNLTDEARSITDSLLVQLGQSYTIPNPSFLAKRAVDPQVAATYAPQVVQQQDTFSALDFGIPRFVFQWHIPPYNAFMTVLFSFLLLCAIFLAVALICAIPFAVMTSRVARRNGGWKTLRLTNGVGYALFRATALRVLIISWFPLTFFTFFQWKLGASDSYAPIVLSVFTFLTTVASIVILSLLCIRMFRRTRREEVLFQGGGVYAPFWNPFKPSRWWFFVPSLVAVFVEALFIAFAQNHGWVQIIALLVIEVLLLVGMCATTPWSDKSSNGMRITIQILKCIVLGALIVFNRSIGLNEIIRVVVGAVLAVIESVVVVIFFILLMIDLFELLLDFVDGFRDHKDRKRGLLPPSSNASNTEEKRPEMMEKEGTDLPDRTSRRLSDSDTLTNTTPGSNESARQGFKANDQV